MDNVYRSFGRDIETSEGSDGPLFNGHSTVHAALLDCNEMYGTFDFADQMMICANVMFDVYPLPAGEKPPQPSFPTMDSGRLFIYTYEWMITGEDYRCMVFDASTGNVIYQEWFGSLQQHGIMESLQDHEGLLMFLLKHGELIEGDILQVHNKPDEDRNLL